MHSRSLALLVVLPIVALAAEPPARFDAAKEVKQWEIDNGLKVVFLVSCGLEG